MFHLPGSQGIVGLNLEAKEYHTMTDQPIRTVRFTPYLKGMGPTFTLTLWNNHTQDRMGKSMIRYRLNMSESGKRSTLFEGADFACSPLHAIDSDGAVEGIMGFLTLRPGDTDAEYFESATDAQVAYGEQHAESLSCDVLGRFGESG